ncbi:hypothetical protein GCM10010472_68410 [Pseudonocardia halophobica]|uniref:Histidine kinase/HSP90-like ATPase domain-containing protein n=1 Tax=Pseudonocardia halophobica TaxID=29401 RepID=A0A9W6L5Q1_9PSEU|nr:ATP-binding protein [Pseudonocardia halophobica]GLL12590.1 hypothetical protein GCM10017577_37310 [Pseudonocardia halophobica]
MFERNEEPPGADGSWSFEPPTEMRASSSRWQMTAPALPKILAPMRVSLIHWLCRVRHAVRLSAELVAVTDEAVSNVVLHAYPNVLGLVRADAELIREPAGQRVRVTVADRGSWRLVDPGVHPGAGLALIENLMDDVSLWPSRNSFDPRLRSRFRHVGGEDKLGPSCRASGLPGSTWFSPATTGTVVCMLSPLMPSHTPRA